MLLYFRMLFLMAISLFTSRVNLQALGVQDFGIYNVIGGVVAMFSMLSGALSVSISRNITFELGRKDLVRLNKVFCTSINIQLMIGLGILVLAETVGVWFLNNKMVIPADRMYAANWVLQFSILSFLVGLLNVPYNSCIIAHEKMSAFAYISILEAVLKLLVAYALYISPIDKLITFGLLLSASSIFLRGIYMSYCKRHFEECTYHFVKDKELLKEMTGFAGWSMFGLVAYTGYTAGLNIILNLFFGPAVNAARGIATQVENAIAGFSKNFQMAINPQIIKNFASNDLQRMHTLIFESSKFAFYLLLCLSLPVIIEAPKVLQIWLGIVPDHTVSFIRLLLIIIIIDSLGSSISTAQQATGKIKVYQIVVGGIMLMIVPVAYVFLKLGGNPETVYWVYLAAVILAHICRMYIIRPMIKLSLKEYIIKVIVPIVRVSVLSIILPILLYCTLPDNLWSFIVVCGVSVISVLAVTYFWGITTGERQMVNNKISSFYGKFCRR